MANFQIAYYQNGWQTTQRKSIGSAIRFAKKIKPVSEAVQIEEYRQMPGGKAFAWFPFLKI